MVDKREPGAKASEQLNASARVIVLPSGLHLFAASGGVAHDSGFPAVHVGPMPGAQDQVEIIMLNGSGGWLCRDGDMLVARIAAPQAGVLINSIKGEDGAALKLAVQQLGGMQDALQQRTKGRTDGDGRATPDAGDPFHGLKRMVTVHLSNLGDVVFEDIGWARGTAREMVEGFSICPTEELSAADVEYKSLTMTGFESPWLTDDELTGSRGMAIPLLGFAIRIKASSPLAGRYSCAYRGQFLSGATVGPLSNGAPCRSPNPDDPLIGIELFFEPRAGKTAKPAIAPRAKAAAGQARK